MLSSFARQTHQVADDHQSEAVALKIAIVYSSLEKTQSPLKDLEVFCDPSPYLPSHRCSHFPIHKATSVLEITKIAQAEFDVVINLCDGAWDEEGRAGIEVVQTLERLNVPFTGASSDFYDPSRETMKMAAHAVGVKFPAYVKATQVEDAERAIAELYFPMIVKHPQSYGSIGLTRDSRVVEPEALRREVKRMIEQYNGALIEEFIEGREFTVLVAEARDETEIAWALAPIEFCFPPGESFKHFDMKYIDFAEMKAEPVRDTQLAARLCEASQLCFAALNGSGYARLDFRMNANGEIFLLELNPYCTFFLPPDQFGSADWILANDPAGHRGFLEHLICCAYRRAEQRRKPWEIRYRRDVGFGLFANRLIKAGELIEQYEESPHVLASRRHIDLNWYGFKRQWFNQYAYPLTTELYALWSANPEDWRPINHACDPNTWLEGLNLVARRDIAVGEELTMDYATFCGPGMAGFVCECGTTNCRQVITSVDYLLPTIRQSYGANVSEFVRAAWQQIGTEGHPPYELIPHEAGFGLVARQSWQAGEVVSSVTWTNHQPHPTRWSLQCEEENHAEPVPIELRYINHSCDPNVEFDLEQNVVRALRTIQPGEELTFFYPATEWSMNEPFQCICGASQCHGYIAGAAHLPIEVLGQYALSHVIRSKLNGHLKKS